MKNIGRSDVDWDSFKEFSPLTCRCSCGGVFCSYMKVVSTPEGLVQAVEKPCPDCGEFAPLRGASSDWETMTIGG